MMKSILTALALSLIASPLWAQSARDLARISAYLNALTDVKGDFVQIAPNGETSDGVFYLKRPGRIRFEYTPPNPTLVVSDGVWVVVFDLRTCRRQTAPLDSTPLDLLLRERVDLKAEGAVQRVERSAGQMRVTAVNPKNPGQGQITLIFNENPLELRQWVVTDAQGQATTVALSKVQRGASVKTSLFLPASIELNLCAEGGDGGANDR